MRIDWEKKPTYEEIIRDLEKDYKVKLPDRVALNFYDSFAHTQFQQMQQSISTSQQNIDDARDHAMSMAADEQDTSRHAILQHAAQMQQQNSAALQEAQRLNAQLQERHERSRQQQAEEMAKLIAQQQVERDNRDRMHQKVIEDLQKHPKVAPTPLPPPTPDNTAVIQNAVRETANAIRGQAVEERDRMYAGMANTVGELVRNMQDAHKQGVSELLNNLNRGFAPTITNLFQSDNRHVTLADQRQVHMSDQRQVHMSDQRQIHNPSSSSTDSNPPMAIQNAPAAEAEEIVPSKLNTSRKKAPKSEAGLAQARLVANLIDGFREARNAHREQLQNDRRLSIEDQAAAAAPRGRAPTLSRAPSRAQSNQTPEYTTKGGQLVMTDTSKRGHPRGQSEGRDRDATPEYPIEGTVLLSEGFKKAKRTPQASVRTHVGKTNTIYERGRSPSFQPVVGPSHKHLVPQTVLALRGSYLGCK